MARLPFSEPWVLSLQIHLTCNQTTREAKNDGIVCVWCVWCVCVRVYVCVCGREQGVFCKTFKYGRTWTGKSSPDYKLVGVTSEILSERLKKAPNMTWRSHTRFFKTITTCAQSLNKDNGYITLCLACLYLCGAKSREQLLLIEVGGLCFGESFKVKLSPKSNLGFICECI